MADVTRRRGGFSLLELLIVIAVILVIIAVALPSAKDAKLNAVETVVIRELQTVHQAQMMYQSQYGTYASSLRELGPPEVGDPGPRAAKLIPRSLAAGEKDGYLFAMTGVEGGYAITAIPKIFGSTGRRCFYLDQDGIVHQSRSREPATANSPELE